MCSGGDNPPMVMHTARPRARVAHRCCECGLPIPPGVVYVRTWGVWDSEVSVFKQHVECLDLLDEISDKFCGGEFWAFGDLRNEIAEYTTDYYGEALSCRMAAIEARYGGPVTQLGRAS